MDNTDRTNRADNHASSIVINKGSLHRIRPWARRIGQAKPVAADTIQLVRLVAQGVVPIEVWQVTSIEDYSQFAQTVMDITARYVNDRQEACLFELSAKNEEGLSVVEPYRIDIAPLPLFGGSSPAAGAATSGPTTFHVGAAPEGSAMAQVDPSAPAIVSTLQLLQNHLAATQRMLIEERKDMATQVTSAYERALEFKDAELKNMETRYAELRQRYEDAHVRELDALDERRSFLSSRADVERQIEQARGAHMERLEDKAIHVGAELSRHVITKVIENIDPSQLADLVSQFGPSVMRGAASSGRGSDDAN